MNTADENEFRGLLSAALEGTPCEEISRRLAALCAADPDLAAKFGAQMDVDRLLEIALRENAGISFTGTVMDRIAAGGEAGKPFVDSVMGRVTRTSRPRRKHFAIGFGIAASFAAAAWFALSRLPAADLHRGESATWSDSQPPGSLRPGQRLQLESGLAEVHFRNGAELILEGPADLEIRGKGRGFLHRGRASVRVPGHASGFTLESPGGRLVDLGTSFGLNVGSEGDTEAEVFEGKLKVSPRGEDTQLVLARNEKFTADRSGWRKSTGINANAFVTNLPPQSQARPRFIHWPLDDGDGTSASAEGTLAGKNPPAAALRNLGNPAAATPAWVPGPYGKALSFDGLGQAMETFHPGPTGDSARTVAFWLRLPTDFDPEQGFGIISWGDLAAEGNAWQISINPHPHEGPVGMLRIGVFPSLVTGSTDLRDGKWHHCAVVLYKDHRDSSRVPILLYVDGKMEATAMKGVISRIHTSEEESSRPVWIARSLRHEEPGRSRGTGFFRGELDEIYIFDSALGQRQIENLMRSNQPPPGLD